MRVHQAFLPPEPPSRQPSEPTAPPWTELPPLRLDEPHDRTTGHGETVSELDCLRGRLPAALLQNAARRSRTLNVGADQVLIRDGLISETAYVQHLARHLGTSFDDLSDVGRGDCPLPDDDLPRIAQSGILPLKRNDALTWVIAPRALAARRLTRLAVTYPSLIGKMHLTTRHHLHQFLTQQAGDVLSEIAAESLRQQRPAMSAAPVGVRQRHPLGKAVLMCGLLLAALFPSLAIDVTGALAAVWFLAFSLLRLVCVLIPQQGAVSLAPLRDDALPMYSIIVALYHEAASVPGLLQALQRIDYPREKLDIILVLEADDLQTRAALARAHPAPQVQMLIAPAHGPKTKPKALNLALPFVRGSFVSVYDAEDDPDAGQLRAALDMFRRHGADVACIQAGLHFDNFTHGPLSRMAAVEYAGLFAVLLPGLAALGMPLPLGGTSNHFRTDVLRRVGGWDPYNVTEDADLGIRLARLGYRSLTIASVTLEEAPIAFGAWLRQRSRWMKGWMQTWAVHMRDPQRLWREAGARGFLAFNIIFGGNILTALAFALLLGQSLVDLVLADLWRPWRSWQSALHVLAVSCGLVTTCVVGLTGLARRGRLRDGWILALTPIYWGCLSIACWRALWQFWTNRYHWEKTEHGLVQRTGTMSERQHEGRQHDANASWRASAAAHHR